VLEAIMATVVAFAAIAIFFGGVTIGILLVVAREVHREDRLYSLGGEAPGMMSKTTRRLTGFGRRDLYVHSLHSRRRLAA
jgi:hypothetical protein